jgi:transcriptional regulator with XRE-family HTH domain
MNKFGEALFDLMRNSLRISFREFEKRTGFSMRTLTRMRRMNSPGEANPLTIKKFCEALGWTIDEFNAWWNSQSGETMTVGITLSPQQFTYLTAYAGIRAITPEQAMREMLLHDSKHLQAMLSADKAASAPAFQLPPIPKINERKLDAEMRRREKQLRKVTRR